MTPPLRSKVQAITAIDVAETLAVHVNTVKRIPPEDLPYFRVGKRGERRYHRRDVLTYIAERTVGRGSALQRPDPRELVSDG